MKAEDMPSGLVGSICCAGYGVHSENCPRVLLHAAQRDLAVQTATAQSLRLIVERAVGVLEIADEALVWKWIDGSPVQEHEADNITHPDCNRCKAAAVVRAFLAEIGARSAEAIQERK